MRRVVNFRCFLLTSTIAVLCVLLYTKTSAALRVILLALVFAALLGLAVSFFAQRDFVKGISFALALLVAFACVFGAKAEIDRHTFELEEKTEYSFVATIEETSGETDYFTMNLRSVEADGKSVNGNMYLSVSSAIGTVIPSLKNGDKIAFKSSVIHRKLETKLGKYSRGDMRYAAFVTADEIQFVGAENNFFDNMRNGMRAILEENIGGYGALAYAVLTGDKGGLDAGVTDYYSASGIGHILAVSGLHVGFITAALLWLLNKLRTNRYVKLAVVSSVLLFYSFIASFSPSVVRASVMCAIGLTADAFGERRDTLSSLCCAATAILLVKPLYIYDVGFVLSVSAVAGILMFADGFNRMLKFLPKFVSGALSVSMAAQLGITPATLVVFGRFAPYSIIANLFVIPIMSVTFVVIVVALVIVAIIPQFGLLLTVSGAGLVAVDLIAKLISLIPFASIIILAEEWFMFSFPLLFVCSKFFMLPKFKWITYVVTMVACAAALTVCNIPTVGAGDIIVCEGYNSVTTVIETPDNGCIVVGDVGASGTIVEVLENVRERKITAIVATRIDKDNARSLAKLCKNYGLKGVYASASANADGIQSLVSEGADIELFGGEKFGLKPVISNGKFVGYGYPSEKLLLLTAGVNPSDLESEIMNDYAVIRSETYGKDYLNRIYLVNFNNSFIDEKPVAVRSATDGNFVFGLSDGTVTNL